MTAADLARALSGRKSGDGWAARCPAHQDRRPSLSIHERHGRILVHCHAGCPQAEVVDALRTRGLWPQAAPERPAGRQQQTLGPVVAEYVYCDEAGAPLYRVTRHVPKTFRQWRPDGCGGWLPGLPQEVRKVPYRLPELLQAEIAFVCEGEKDADVLREHGFAATCNSGGACKWLAQFDRYNWAPYFRDKVVLVVPDDDAPGRRHALEVARSLQGVARVIGLLLPPAPAKDAAEAFGRGLWSDVYICNLIDEVLGEPDGITGFSNRWAAA